MHLTKTTLPSIGNIQHSSLADEARWRSGAWRHLQSLTAVAFAVAIILLIQLFFSSSLISNQPPKLDTRSLEPSLGTLPAHVNTLELAAAAPIPTIASIVTLENSLLEEQLAGNTAKVHASLLVMASDAVRENNNTALADAMTLLGENALIDWETDSAGVYLAEALALYTEQENLLGMANVNLQIGRLHVIERRRARRAALAYDNSLLARGYLAHNELTVAETLLNKAVKQNLALNRHGAAASDYESLLRVYTASGNTERAIHAATEASQMYASSGRSEKAVGLVDRLHTLGVSTYETDAMKLKLQSLVSEYETSTQQIGQAVDYDRLYNHFINEGDPVSAWRFRLKSNKSLSKASKRALYRRQAGVLTLLYDSNDHMVKANRALNRARELFETQNLTASSDLNRYTDQAVLLLREIY